MLEIREIRFFGMGYSGIKKSKDLLLLDSTDLPNGPKSFGEDTFHSNKKVSCLS